ncbi:YggS family pyridoxal phosphate-dependent enzyme [Pelagibacterales bacterium SAG-MED47]|nr:YggS family pyridoxal phosphate-dependent enzyme [Pelagibacterales bacterium SAG-MED47]
MHQTIKNLNLITKELSSLEKKLPSIIAVSKTFSMSEIMPLIKFGHIHFGENKVQEAVEKWTDVKKEFKNIKLHMIGKLQTNKVKYAIPLFDYIHSVDNIKLATKISSEQKKINRNLKIFIQINLTNEIQKSGIEPDQLSNFYNICKNELGLNIVGLMCIPPNDKNSNYYFSEMKKLKSNLELDDLSMGMSGDYLNAIQHGSSFIRVGSKIFGSRN